MLSQIDDIPPESFCNGDNKPANCGRNCMCSHKVDIPMHAVVEVVLVDEGNQNITKTRVFVNCIYIYKCYYYFS